MEYNERTGDFERSVCERIGWYFGWTFWWLRLLFLVFFVAYIVVKATVCMWRMVS